MIARHVALVKIINEFVTMKGESLSLNLYLRVDRYTRAQTITSLLQRNGLGTRLILAMTNITHICKLDYSRFNCLFSSSNFRMIRGVDTIFKVGGLCDNCAQSV